jgi:hypothetical protein
MAFSNKGGAQSMHQIATLKNKQPATTIEILVICLSLSNESPIESFNVDSTKKEVEVLDQNLSLLKIHKT